MYLSILRGINVSGKNPIKMDALKKMYEDIGFTNVITYIQSGNVIFNSKKSRAQLSTLIEENIKSTFGYDVPVIVLTLPELSKIVSNNPFLKRDNIQEDKLHITFLAETPDAERLNNIDALKFTPDEFGIVNNAVYLYCPNGYGKTKLTNNFFESKLKVKATTRNWKTSNVLLKMMQ